MLESTIQARLIGNYTASNWEEARCLWQCLEMGKFCTKKTSLLRHLPLLKSQDPETTVLFLIWSSISYPLIHHSVISLVLSEVFCNYTIKFKITIVAQKRCHPQKKNTSSPFFCVYSLYWSFFSDVLNIAIWCSKIYTTSRSDTLQKVAFAFSSVVTFATTWVSWLVVGWFISGTVNYQHFHTNQSLAPRFGNLKTSALWTHRFSEAMRTLSRAIGFFFLTFFQFLSVVFVCWKTAKKWTFLEKKWLASLASLGRLMKHQVKMWGWRRGPVQHPFPRLKLPGSEPEATFLETLISQVGDALGSYGSKKDTRYIDCIYVTYICIYIYRHTHTILNDITWLTAI